MPGSYFCQRTLLGEGQRCLCDEDAKLFPFIAARASYTDLPWKKKEKEEIELIIKKMSYETVVLFEYFSTLFMKVCTSINIDFPSRM